jgi:hypothetical protein
MAPAEEVISGTTPHFRPTKKCQRNENPAVRGGGYEYHGQTRGVQALVMGCALASLMGMEIPSKNALILRKAKSILYSILHTQNIYLHVGQIPLQKWVFEMWQ